MIRLGAMTTALRRYASQSACYQLDFSVSSGGRTRVRVSDNGGVLSILDASDDEPRWLYAWGPTRAPASFVQGHLGESSARELHQRFELQRGAGATPARVVRTALFGDAAERKLLARRDTFAGFRGSADGRFAGAAQLSSADVRLQLAALARLAYHHLGWSLDSSAALARLPALPEQLATALHDDSRLTWRLDAVQRVDADADDSADSDERVQLGCLQWRRHDHQFVCTHNGTRYQPACPPSHGLLAVLMEQSVACAADPPPTSTPNLCARQRRDSDSDSDSDDANPVTTAQLTSIEVARQLIAELCKARRFCDAVLVVEEWHLQCFDRSLEEAKSGIREELKKDTVLKFWPTPEAKRAHALMDIGSTALLSDFAGQQLTPSEARQRLDQLRSFDTIVVERDHVLEALRGMYAALVGKLDDAELYLLEALRQNPRLAVAYKLLGDVYLRRHRPALAWACWQHARVLCPALVGAPIEANITQAESSLKNYLATLSNNV